MERKTDNQVDMSRREEGHVLRRMLVKGRRARAKKNVRCTSTRKETERKTDSQVDMSREGKKGTC